MGLVTQSARFYCRPVREHSWARYFSSASIISSPFTGSLYSLCCHNVFRYCKVKFSGQNYAELALRNIRWFIVRRLMPRYYTPPLLSRFPIIRLYCYSFPSSLFPESIWSKLAGRLYQSTCESFSGVRIFTSLLHESWWPAGIKRSRKTFYHFWIFIFRECWWCIISFFLETDYCVYDSHINLYIVL